MQVVDILGIPGGDRRMRVIAIYRRRSESVSCTGEQEEISLMIGNCYKDMFILLKPCSFAPSTSSINPCPTVPNM